MLIRRATMDDLKAVAALEKACFVPEKAASEASYKDRLTYFADHFWLMFDGDKLISFVIGFVTDEADLTDEMFAHADMHDENGAWQMIFSVGTLPEYQKKGYAGQLMVRMIEDAKEQGRKGLVLTCKEEKLHYYGKFGFENEGISVSDHGGVVWYQMRLTF